MDLASSAQRDSIGENLAEAFFSRPPYPEEVAFDDWQLPPMRSSQRFAMHLTLGTLICGALSALALLVF